MFKKYQFVIFHFFAAVLTFFIAFKTISMTKDIPSGVHFYTDHFSNWMSIVVALRHGMLSIYEKPIGEYCDNSASVEAKKREIAHKWRLHEDFICIPKGNWFHRPLAISWQQLPRPYPPGIILSNLTEALLYKYTNMSFERINRITLIKLFIAAHLCWIALSLALRSSSNTILHGIVLMLAYSSFMYWTIKGEYDCIGVIGVLLSVFYYNRAQNYHAIFWFSWACFLHFKTLWFIPFIVVVTISELTKYRLRWKHLSCLKTVSFWKEHYKETTLTVLSLGMLTAAAVAFLLLMNVLVNHPVHNQLYYKAGSVERIWGYNALIVIISLLLFSRREWSALIHIVWISVFIQTMPYTREWYTIYTFSLIPILVAGHNRGKSDLITIGIIWCIATSYYSFHGQMIWLDWLRPFFEGDWQSSILFGFQPLFGPCPGQ